jgi:hypothetical protein
MDDESGRIRKEEVLSSLIYVLSQFYWKGLRNITKNIRVPSVPAEIRTDHLPNTSLQCYCYNNTRRITFIIILSGVRLSPLGTAATTGLLYQPQMIDDGDCEAIGGMKIGR